MPFAYIPHRQNTSMARSANVLARTRSDPAQATKILREAMMGVDPDQALATPRTMDESLAQNVGCCACSRQCFRYLP